MKLYLDVCCLNRPFDDQSQGKIRLEAEAVLLILNFISDGEWQLISSEAIVYEIERTPDVRRKNRVKRFHSLISTYISFTGLEFARARELQKLGFGDLDALHLSCAESGEADIFLTTDDKLLNLAIRLAAQLRVQIANPLSWLERVRR